MSARSVPRSRIRIFRMNNCWANAYLRAKAGEPINVHAPGTDDDARRELMRIALVQLILRSRTSQVPAVGGNVGFPPIRPDGFVGRRRTRREPNRFPSCEGTVRRFEGSCRAQGTRMEHSTHLHPEFGLLSPTPRLRRELRIAASSLLFGGIAGALCVSGVIALRHSDRASMEIAEAPRATASADAASRESDPGNGPSTDARAASGADTRTASSENQAGTAARPQASAEMSVQRASETSAPESAVAPKPRMVRIRKAIDSPAIARLPLGRSEAPATDAPLADTPESTQASNASNAAAPAGSDVPASAPEKAGVSPGPRGAVANSSPPKKKVQKTVRTASTRRDDIESDPFWRDERTDDWSARPAAPVSADVPRATPDKAVTRPGAREGLVDPSPPTTVRNASSRRNDTGNDPFSRDERTDDWSARPDARVSADVAGAAPAGAREGLADSSPPKKASKTVRNANSRRNDAGNDSFWRDDRQDDWNARAAAVNDARNPVGRANAREAASSFRGFWDWSR